MDLTEYAATPEGRNTWVTKTLPPEIDAQIAASWGKIPVTKIKDWLLSEGYEGATAARLRSHYDKQ